MNLTDFKVSIAGYSEDGKIADEMVAKNYIFDLGKEKYNEFVDILNSEIYVRERSNYVKTTLTRSVDESKIDVELPHGMLCIVGPSNTGKSAIARHIAKSLGVENTRFHEPEFPALLSPRLLLSKINNFIHDVDSEGRPVEFQKVMVIDSLKFFAYNTGGHTAAISGGISTALFTDLTNLSLLAASLGKTIVAVLNFISEDDRSRPIILNGLIGSTGGYISTGSTTVKTDRFRFTFSARTPQSQRKEVEYYITPDFTVDGNSNIKAKSDRNLKIKTMSKFSIDELHRSSSNGESFETLATKFY